MQDINEALIDFIRRSPDAFHAAAEIGRRLDEAGFERLSESRAWKLKNGGKYYVTRNGSSVIAFRTAGGECRFRIFAAHDDSPTFRLKDAPELAGPEGYLRLNVEAYGGMIDSTWLDRPLGLAGRVMVRSGGAIESRLLNIDRDVLLIPNLCIHFNREVNKGFAYNRAVDLCPLVSAGELKKGGFDALIAAELGVKPEDIVSKELSLVCRQPGSIWGFEQEFVSSPRLDDMQCVFAGLEGFLRAENPEGVAVLAVLDNEEVGSGTKQGALSTFLKDTLRRMSAALGKSEDELLRAVAASFFISADNAHAVHPNHPEKSDAENRCYMNKGVVIKENAAQSYMTDAFSRAALTELCARAGVPWQRFANRSDSAGGSTLGNLSNVQVSLHGADIGLAQLAMHSSYETAGARDTEYAAKLAETYFSTPLRIEGAERIVIG